MKMYTQEARKAWGVLGLHGAVSCLVSASVFRTNERNKKVVSRSRHGQQPGTKHSHKTAKMLGRVVFSFLTCSKVPSFLKMNIRSLDGLDLEMEPDEGEHQALQILQHSSLSQRSWDFKLREVLQHLDQVVETAEAVRVSRLVDINLRKQINSLPAELFLWLPSCRSCWLWTRCARPQSQSQAPGSCH